MSSNNQEIQHSPNIQSPKDHSTSRSVPIHPITSSPVMSVQSPQSQSPREYSSPIQSSPKQNQHPGTPKQASKFNYFHTHQEIKHKITANDLKNFRVAFTSKIPNDKQIRSIDFCASGIAGLFNTQDIIHFIWLNPEHPQEKSFKLSKYGTGVCRFLNPYDRIIHTSTKVDDFVRLFNVAKNGYDIYFKGHNAEVTGLEVLPLWHKNFVSASKDNSVKFWDIRQENCVKSMNFPKLPIIACHPKNLQVAVAYASGSSSYIIEVYDLHTLEVGNPIAKLGFDDQEFQWKTMKFSNNGKYLSINTDSTLTILIDVETGVLCRRLHGEFWPWSCLLEFSRLPYNNP